METLEIGSGQTPQDWEHIQAEHQEELRGDIRMAANFFFVAAGCAAISSGLAPLRFTFFVDVGYMELAHMLTRTDPFAFSGSLAAFVAIAAVTLGIIGSLVLLGIAGRAYKRWAFWAGLVIYGIDSVLLIFFFSFLSLGLHGFFLWKWWEAQRAIGELTTTAR
jgi:hypothetical protein